MSANEFWEELQTAVRPTNYQPNRRQNIITARLTSRDETYYILKQPDARTYLRLSEEDYALWWQMNGRKSVKQLLFYNLKRFKSLPIGRFSRLVEDLRQGHFLQDEPANIYDQLDRQLTERAPAGKGRRLLNAFLQTEAAVDGLDAFFIPFYKWTGWLFSAIAQTLLLLIILIGGGMFGLLFWRQTYRLVGGGGWSWVTLLAANLIVIAVHEAAHGLATKHFGRELNRGGFLIYWGLPAFFVDTRDIWLSPRRARILVSWAGPHSGLIIGGLAGMGLTAVSPLFSELIIPFWATFLYQIAFIAYLSVFVNLNPLLELDGYFILMDWLEMPGLRRRAIRFWREELWGKWRRQPEDAAQTRFSPRRIWRNLSHTEQIFSFYGGLTIAYSAYALFFALYFWQTRLTPFIIRLWQDYGLPGQALLLLLTTLIVVPAVYFIIHYGWSRIRAGLEWLARRNLLSRPDVLALLIGLPLLLGIPAVALLLIALPGSTLGLILFVWLLHLAAVSALIGVARQLPGSRFQWAIWSLSIAPFGLAAAWMGDRIDIFLLRGMGLLTAVASIFIFGVVSIFTARPHRFSAADFATDRWLPLIVLLAGGLYAAGLYALGHTLNALVGLILAGIFIGLALAVPLLLNFWRSRFALPWGLLILAIIAVPLLIFYPLLHLPILIIWLYGGVLYWLLGALAEFHRYETDFTDTAVFSERRRLVDGFNHFMSAFFMSYEAVFGGRRLTAVQAQMQALGAINPNDGIIQIGDHCRAALLLAIDRLDDLAGTPFTQKAGRAAYDSLPWLEAETMGRHVLSRMEWGGHLAKGFIQAQDKRVNLIRQADIFAGLDSDGINEVAAVLGAWAGRKRAMLGRQDHPANRFFLIESGEVGVFEGGRQVGVITAGGYCGVRALLAKGGYERTYQALTAVRALTIRRQDFDPFLRADTTLAHQVNAGAETRDLLRKMSLFRGLSPQQLGSVDARLQHRRLKAGDLVVKEGQARSDLFIIASGQVQVSTADGETEQKAGVLGPGEHFGEYALFADTPYRATYRALTDAELLLLDEEKFDQLAADCDLMSHYVEQIGSGRVIASR